MNELRAYSLLPIILLDFQSLYDSCVPWAESVVPTLMKLLIGFDLLFQFLSFLIEFHLGTGVSG